MAELHDDAYRRGAAGRPLTGAHLRAAERDPSITEAWREGRVDRAQDDDPAAPEPATVTSLRAPRGASTPPSSSSSAPSSAGRQLSVPRRAVHTAAGAALGLVAAALAVSIIDYGVKGPWYWFEAKFLDRVDAAVSGGTQATAATTSSVSAGQAFGVSAVIAPTASASQVVA